MKPQPWLLSDCNILCGTLWWISVVYRLNESNFIDYASCLYTGSSLWSDNSPDSLHATFCVVAGCTWHAARPVCCEWGSSHFTLMYCGVCCLVHVSTSHLTDTFVPCQSRVGQASGWEARTALLWVVIQQVVVISQGSDCWHWSHKIMSICIFMSYILWNTRVGAWTYITEHSVMWPSLHVFGLLFLLVCYTHWL
jgi:hypothetical protein